MSPVPFPATLKPVKKVIVIGGGIAGLSAGVYARKCGFDVTVLESHAVPGGNCTSWRRGGYLFEGGMHWLSGSDKNEPLNRLWRHIGALDDGVKIRRGEPYLEYGDTPVRLYRDVDQTERHLLEVSPADAAEIRKFCGNIRRVKNLAMPVADLRGVRTTKKNRPPLTLLFAALSALGVMRAFSKISPQQYADRFSHEEIREMLRDLTNGKGGVLPLFFTLGTLARGDGGFPEGGSLPFVRRIVKTFASLGGELLCGTRAERVIIEGGKATGVVAAGRLLQADAVIVASDTMAVDGLFDAPPKARWLDKMRAAAAPTMCTFVSLGVNADLAKYPHGFVFKPARPIGHADQNCVWLGVNNYASDPAYSPAGKTALTAILSGDTYDFWKRAKAEGRYDGEKRKIAEAVTEAVEARMPEARGKVEVVDVATPLTYERYCGNWKGSWMTELDAAGPNFRRYPATIKGTGGVYFAGQRMMPPGGLPVALMSGRAAVQRLCRDTGTLFASEE